MVQEAINTVIMQAVENSIGFSEDQLISKESLTSNSTIARSFQKVIVYLDRNYSNIWIGKQESFLEWPPHCPDLAPDDFFSVWILEHDK